MPIFYRSDVRPPEEIFQKGFTPKTPLKLFDEKYQNEHKKMLNEFREKYCSRITDDYKVKVIYWFHRVLRPSFLPEDSEEEFVGPIIDVDPSYVVSLSYNLASTPIFPVASDVTQMYIYAISLPEAKIPYYAKMRFGRTTETINAALNPFTIQENLAYDLHSLQTESISYCHGSLTETSVEYRADSLCAYEAFATSISPSNIICATECTRSSVIVVPREAKMTPEAEFASLFQEPFDRTFTCGDTIIVNEKFDAAGDRAEVQAQVIASIRSLANKTLNTTSICYGLAGKTFHVPYSLPYSLPALKPNIECGRKDTASRNFTLSFNRACAITKIAALTAILTAIIYKVDTTLGAYKKARL